MSRSKFAQTIVMQCCASLIALLLATGCSGLFNSNVTSEVVRGSGNVVTESRPVSGFSRVELAGTGNIIITQGDTESLIVEAEDNLLPYLTTEVRGERLILDQPDNVTLENTEPIIFHVTLIDLAEVGVSGTGSIASDNLDVESLSAYLSGTGTITLAGNVDQQTINLSGSGNYQGSDLLSREALITIAGTGNALVNSTDILNATISGTGFVQYLGSPQVTENISGVGGVTPFSSDE
jgi:hypothetical protein